MKSVTLLIFILVLSVNLSFAATYVVDKTGDVDNALAYTLGDGTNSIRKCIRLANASGGVADIINFSIAATFTLSSALPTLTDLSGVTIDGTTAPGWAANTNVTGPLNATLKVVILPTTYNSFDIQSNNNIVKGL